MSELGTLAQVGHAEEEAAEQPPDGQQAAADEPAPKVRASAVPSPDRPMQPFPQLSARSAVLDVP